MAWHFSTDKPIYMQLYDRILFNILSGEYIPGTRVPAVRDIAVTAGVNPNTVQRAMSELENTGLIYTARGEGRFVTEDEALIAAEREKAAETQISLFLASMRKIGLSDEESVSLLQKEIDPSH